MRLLLDVFILLILMAYITLGTEKVPFHGDESTTIWMSRDFDTIVLDGDFDAVAYKPPPRRTTEQHMRIITSNVSKLVMGTAWYQAGFKVDEINDQWVWGLDRTWNQENGHIPSKQLLLVTRLTSAWMAALGLVFLLAMTRVVSRVVLINPLAISVAGWGAMFLYAIHPSILVNGRRAMFEGGLLFSLTLLGWLALRVVCRIQKFPLYLMLGIGAGVALSTKHSTVFTILLLFGSLALIGFYQLFKQKDWRPTFYLALGTVVALLVFLILNPLWWSQPLKVAAIVLDEREKILDEQVSLFGGYKGFSERLTGLWDETLRPIPQYFEADYWEDYAGVQQEIETYEASLFSGWANGHDIVLYAVRVSALLFGFQVLLQTIRAPRTRLLSGTVMIWLIGILIVTIITVPLHWQRYYLPIQPPLILVMGLGLGRIVESAFYAG